MGRAIWVRACAKCEHLSFGPGAVLAMAPVSNETAAAVTEALRAASPASGLTQVNYVSTDDPSPALLASLRQIMPNLHGLCLDSTHLAMVYEYATWFGPQQRNMVDQLHVALVSRHDVIMVQATGCSLRLPR